MENVCSIANAPRKGLSDMTNLQQQPKVVTKVQSCCCILLYSGVKITSTSSNRKVIELSGIELQKLRVSLEKFQQQNLLLAQANSLMLAELNSGKDRLKALKHELGCKNVVLKAIKSEVGSKAGESPKGGGN